MEEHILPYYIVTGNTSLLWRNKSFQITLSQGTYPYNHDNGRTNPANIPHCHREHIPTMEEQMHPNYIIITGNPSLLWRNRSIQITSLPHGTHPYYGGTIPSKLNHYHREHIPTMENKSFILDCHREHIHTMEEQIHPNYIIVTGNTSLLWRNKFIQITSLSQGTHPYYAGANPSKLHHCHREHIPTMEEQILPNCIIVTGNTSLLWRNKFIQITSLLQEIHPYYGGTYPSKLHVCHRERILTMEEHIHPNIHFCHKENIPTMEDQIHPNYIIDTRNTSLLLRKKSLIITSLSQGTHPYYGGTNPSKLHVYHREHIPTMEEHIHPNYTFVTGNTSLPLRNKSIQITPLSQGTDPY